MRQQRCAAEQARPYRSRATLTTTAGAAATEGRQQQPQRQQQHQQTRTTSLKQRQLRHCLVLLAPLCLMSFDCNLRFPCAQSAGCAFDGDAADCLAVDGKACETRLSFGSLCRLLNVTLTVRAVRLGRLRRTDMLDQRWMSIERHILGICGEMIVLLQANVWWLPKYVSPFVDTKNGVRVAAQWPASKRGRCNLTRNQHTQDNPTKHPTFTFETFRDLSMEICASASCRSGQASMRQALLQDSMRVHGIVHDLQLFQLSKPHMQPLKCIEHQYHRLFVWLEANTTAIYRRRGVALASQQKETGGAVQHIGRMLTQLQVQLSDLARSPGWNLQPT